MEIYLQRNVYLCVNIKQGTMKIKRKLYPSSPDKEFVLMSINDLVDFGFDVHFEISNQLSTELAKDGVRRLINDRLEKFDLKTPASHIKKTKKTSDNNMSEKNWGKIYSNLSKKERMMIKKCSEENTGLHEDDSPF